MDKQFEKTYAITKEEWVDFNTGYTAILNKSQKRIKLIALLFSFIMTVYNGYILFNYLAQSKTDILLYGMGIVLSGVWMELVFFGIFLVFTIIYIYDIFFRLNRQIKNLVNDPANRLMFVERQLIINEKGIHTLIEENESLYTWDRVVDVYNSSDYLALIFDNKNATLILKDQCSQEELDVLKSLYTQYADI